MCYNTIKIYGVFMIRLSITGADNNTKINELTQLSEKHYGLELALLYFPEKENQNRNPGQTFRDEFFNQIKKENTALHLCGKKVFEEILSPYFTSTNVFKELQKASRLQLNINARFDLFSKLEIHTIYEKLLNEGFELILQYHTRSEHWILDFIEKRNNEKINILLDSSLGKGVYCENFVIPPPLMGYNYPLGFAGGLNENNIAHAHEQIKKLNLKSYWLDLESGVRTKNEFDMSKATALCEKVFI